MHRILCAVDHSDPSVRAARLAASLANKCDAELVLVGVVGLPRGRQNEIAAYLSHERNPNPPGAVLMETAEDELMRLADQLAGNGGVAITCEVRGGDAANEIVAAAKDRGADLVVVGHRGQGRLAQVIMGSVARRILETAPCPVLVVR